MDLSVTSFYYTASPRVVNCRGYRPLRRIGVSHL